MTMNIFRTDGQAALNSLIKAARETLDHYRDAIELVEENHAQLFREISQQRHNFIHRFEDAVRASGSLPAVPDPDKEAGEMLIHHVAALIKTDYAPDIFEQRIDSEKNLANELAEAKDTELKTSHANLLSDFEHHIVDTIKRLQHEHEKLVAQAE